jgi:uncharacterized protein
VNAFPAKFREGVRHFNAGRYFEAHEAFEESLDDLESDGRWDLALALVQVAVGYHKWTSGHPGAARMLRLGGEKLAPFPADAWGIDLDPLRRKVTVDAEAAGHGAALDAPPLLVPTRR